MKLSVIVPVYNMAGEGKLNFCLDSLLNQTIADYEIIAVDDASTDNSLEVLRRYEAENPGKIRVIASEKNAHQGGAKNKGLREARGEWIGFVDSDDWVAPDMYEKLIKRAEETGADMVGCDYSLVERHTFEVGRIIPNSRDDQTGELGTSQKRSLVLDGGSLCVKIYRRERILKDGLFFPEGIFYEDNAVGNSYLLGAVHYEYVKEPLYYYYQHSTSTVHTITKERSMDRVIASRMLLSEAKRAGYYDELKPEIDYKYIILFYTNTVFSYAREGKHVSLKFIRDVGKEFIENLPDYAENPYFKERISKEEKRLMALQLKSTLLFFIYYRALWTYRKIKKGK